MKRPSLASLRRSSVCRLHWTRGRERLDATRKDTALRAPLINRHFANVERALTYKFSIRSLTRLTRPVLTLSVTVLVISSPTRRLVAAPVAVQRDAHTDRDSWKRSTALERLSAGAESTRDFCWGTPKSALFCENGPRLDLRGSECCADSQSAAPHLGGTPSDTGLAH